MMNYSEVAEFYRTAAKSIYENYIIAQEKCRPGAGTPKAAENKPDERSCLYNSTEGIRCQDKNKRECVRP